MWADAGSGIGRMPSKRGAGGSGDYVEGRRRRSVVRR
jgi:hypothetical protein